MNGAFGLPRRQRGQVATLFALGAMGLVMLLLMLLNTGSFLEQRIQVRNAADAAAMAQANWVARSLNTMALNNVAITQGFGLSVLAAVVNELVSKAQELATERLLEYQTQLAGCTNEAICQTLQANIDDLRERVMAPLTAILEDQPLLIQQRFQQITRSLAEMNHQIAVGFPTFSADVQRSLALANGLGGNDFQFYAEPGADPVTTGLPVIPLTLGEPVNLLCLGGEYGGDGERFGNFRHRGYATGIGPLTQGRMGVEKLLEEPLAALENVHSEEQDGENGEDGETPVDFALVLASRWQHLCTATRLPTDDTGLPLYTMAEADLTDPRWSLLAFTRLQRDRAWLWPADFREPVQAMFAVAGASVANGVSHDLYTQHWWSHLAPTRLLEAGRQDAIVQALGGFRRPGRQDHQHLTRVLQNIGGNDLMLLHHQ